MEALRPATPVFRYACCATRRGNIFRPVAFGEEKQCELYRLVLRPNVQQVAVSASTLPELGGCLRANGVQAAGVPIAIIYQPPTSLEYDRDRGRKIIEMRVSITAGHHC